LRNLQDCWTRRERVGWSLSVDERTLSRDKVPLTAGSHWRDGVAIRLEIPAVRDGVIVEARLSVEVYDAAGKSTIGNQQRRLQIFSSNPFAGQLQWLRQLKVALFDPRGDTAAVLQQAKVPFHQVFNAAALEELKEGMVVIGQGTPLADYRWCCAGRMSSPCWTSGAQCIPWRCCPSWNEAPK